jgi:hypothetical protein
MIGNSHGIAGDFVYFFSRGEMENLSRNKLLHFRLKHSRHLHLFDMLPQMDGWAEDLEFLFLGTFSKELVSFRAFDLHQVGSVLWLFFVVVFNSHHLDLITLISFFGLFGRVKVLEHGLQYEFLKEWDAEIGTFFREYSHGLIQVFVAHGLCFFLLITADCIVSPLIEDKVEW